MNDWKFVNNFHLLFFLCTLSLAFCTFCVMCAPAHAWFHFSAIFRHLLAWNVHTFAYLSVSLNFQREMDNLQNGLTINKLDVCAADQLETRYNRSGANGFLSLFNANSISSNVSDSNGFPAWIVCLCMWWLLPYDPYIIQIAISDAIPVTLIQSIALSRCLFVTEIYLPNMSPVASSS